MTRITCHEDADELLDESASLWRITAAPLVWAAHFLFCYVGAAIWCAKIGSAEGLWALRLSILGLTVLALAAIFWIGWRSRDLSTAGEVAPMELRKPRHRHRFLSHAAFLLAIISFVGVVYVAMPALFIGTCR